MLHQNRAVPHSLIKIVPVKRPRSFAVVIQKPEHPLAWWRLLRAFVKQLFYRFDRILIAGYSVEMFHPGFNRVRMSVIEAGQNSLEAEIQFARASS